MLDPALTPTNHAPSGRNYDMSARTRPRSSAASDHRGISFVELLVAAPVVVVLALGVLQWS